MTAGLLPYLHGSAVVMGHPVCLAVELIGEPILIGFFTNDIVYMLNGPVRSQVSRGKYYFRPQGLEDFYPFFADRF